MFDIIAQLLPPPSSNQYRYRYTHIHNIDVTKVTVMPTHDVSSPYHIAYIVVAKAGISCSKRILIMKIYHVASELALRQLQ